jgi:aminoglycoside/choline kinase family phosphotransferase
MSLAHSHPAGEIAFVNVQRYLALSGLSVPNILCDDAAQGFILLQDLGDVTLEAALQAASREQMVVWYRQALDMLLQLQYPQDSPPRSSCVAFGLAFDVEKLMWELDFFAAHMLHQLCGQRLTAPEQARLRGQFWKLTARLASQPRVFTHRDYHSRNLMVQQNRVYVIDFQDARLGPCQYDLASLLYDAYVVLPADVREELLAYYLDHKTRRDGHAPDRERFFQVFDYMCLQRHLKALGTFAFQTVVKNSERYLPAIPPTLDYIRSTLARHRELDPLSDLLQAYLFEPIPNALRDAEKRSLDRSLAR